MNANRKGQGAAIAFLVVLLLITFWKSFDPDLCLFTTDDPLGVLFDWKRHLPQGWLAWWGADNLLGIGYGQMQFQLTNLLLWLMPPPLFVNWIYSLHVFGAFVFFFLFLRLRKCSALAACFGALVYSYGSASFSLVHSGHLGKFACFVWFAATLWALEHALEQPKRWSWRVAMGLFLGWTVSEQPDLAILYVWLFAVYLAFRVFGAISELPEAEPTRARSFRFVSLLVVSGLISGLVSANVVLTQYQSQVKGVVQVEQENKEQSWNWATQWSYPPEETLELIAPGFFGWGLDNPTGPYWGRTGQSAEYPATKQGFARFKLDTSYLGIVPVFLAVSMAVFAFPRRFRELIEPSLRRELQFWAIIGAIVLLLAYGRHFFLYGVFYSIPKMNIIRNPNKFVHLFAVAVAVLSAHGMHRLVEERGPAFPTRQFWKLLAGLGALALLGAFCVIGTQQSLMLKFHEEFQRASPDIVTGMTNAFLRLAVSCGIFAVLWFWVTRLPSGASGVKAAVPYLVILLAGADLYLTNRHYVDYYEYRAMYAENDLIRFFRQDPDAFRSKILSRDHRDPFYAIYNNWLTFLFPYDRVQTFDIPQMPRMPEDYQRYLATLQGNPLRLWQLTNCKYLIGPWGYWEQIRQMPEAGPLFNLAFAYNLVPANDTVSTVPMTVTNQTSQAVIRYSAALPRVKFYDRWLSIPDDGKCLATLTSKDFNPDAEVIVSDAMPSQSGLNLASTMPEIEWQRHGDVVSEFRVKTDRVGIVLLNEKFDPAFVVTVDGKPAPLFRCNYIMKGTLVVPGTHDVRFEYRPPRIGLYVSLAGWIGSLVAIPCLGLMERKRNGKPLRKRSR